MKFLKLFLFLIALSTAAVGQSMKYSYEMYSYSAYNPTTKTLSQTVTVEGSSTGNCPFPCGNPPAAHTSHITNTLTFSGVVSGGTTTSPGHNPFTYFSDSTTTAVVVKPSDDLDDITEGSGGSVICNYAGTIFAVGFLSNYIEPAFTLTKWVSTVDERLSGCCTTVYDVNVIDWCTAATTPPDNSISYIGAVKAVEPFYEVWAVCVRLFPTESWTCEGEGVEYPLKNAPKATCTKNFPN